MKVAKALKLLQNQESIVVRDKTFEPHALDEFKLDSGETMYWIKDGEMMWMALDLESEEVVLFNEVEAEVDATQENVFFAGDDYEFTYEASAKVYDEEEEIDSVDIKDFTRSDGTILRVMEYEVTGDVMTVLGVTVPEEELMEA